MKERKMSNQGIRKPLLIKEIIAELRTAATVYRSTRKRAAIRDFLETVYTHYWAIKKSPKIRISKSKLKSKAKLSADGKVPLSSLILKVASADFDRRDLHRWKSLLEAAYANQIHPKKFKRKLIGLHGINGALAYWTNNTPKRSKPRRKSFSFSPSFNPAPPVKRLSAEAQPPTRPEPNETPNLVRPAGISQLENT
jgi:hypothetical protein